MTTDYSLIYIPELPLCKYKPLLLSKYVLNRIDYILGVLFFNLLFISDYWSIDLLFYLSASVITDLTEVIDLFILLF